MSRVPGQTSASPTLLTLFDVCSTSTRSAARTGRRFLFHVEGTELTLQHVLSGQRTGHGGPPGRPSEYRVEGMLTAIGIVIFAIAILASIALHELSHMIPAKEVRREGHRVHGGIRSEGSGREVR